jgi:hypothetical protein
MAPTVASRGEGGCLCSSEHAAVDEVLDLLDGESHAASDVDRCQLAVPDELVERGAPDGAELGCLDSVDEKRLDCIDRGACGAVGTVENGHGVRFGA